MPRTLVLLLLWILATLAMPRSAAAQATAPDLQTYTALLREARAAAARGDQIDLATAARRLEEARSVRLPDGRSAPVDNRWLATARAVPNPDLSAIAMRLGALLDALAYVGPPADANAAERLAAILAAPPFSQPERTREPTWFDHFITWLIEQFGRMFSQVAPAGGSAPGQAAAWILIGLGVLLVLGVFGIWLRGLRGSLRPDARLPRPDDPEATLNATGALQQANGLARDGDYRNATRLLYLSALLWLDERGALRYERNLTNREYVLRLREQPELRERLVPVVDMFDRVWYGHQPVDAAAFDTYKQQVDRLRSAAEQRP